MQFQRNNEQVLVNGFPVLSFPSEARQTKYFSLNPFLPDAINRCPLDCAYCVCHMDKQWHHHPDHFSSIKTQKRLITGLLDRVLATSQGLQGFPISLCDYSDPFLKVHQPRVIQILDELIARQAKNMVYITTKVHPGKAFLNELKSRFTVHRKLRLTVFVSLPPLKEGYEFVSIKQRVNLIKDLVAMRLPVCWYIRPLVEEWFDETLFKRLCDELVCVVPDHIILSGVVMSKDIEAALLDANLTVPDWNEANSGKKQLLSPQFEKKVRGIVKQAADNQNINLGPVMSHRLCGTNGNHAYGCLICKKQDRYCQFFQVHHYGASVISDENQKIKIKMVT